MNMRAAIPASMTRVCVSSAVNDASSGHWSCVLAMGQRAKIKSKLPEEITDVDRFLAVFSSKNNEDEENRSPVADVEQLASALQNGRATLARASAIFVDTVWLFAFGKLPKTPAGKEKKKLMALIASQANQVRDGKNDMSRDMFHPVLLQKAEQVRDEGQK